MLIQKKREIGLIQIKLKKELGPTLASAILSKPVEQFSTPDLEKIYRIWLNLFYQGKEAKVLEKIKELNCGNAESRNLKSEILNGYFLEHGLEELRKTLRAPFSRANIRVHMQEGFSVNEKMKISSKLLHYYPELSLEQIWEKYPVAAFHISQCPEFFRWHCYEVFPRRFQKYQKEFGITGGIKAMEEFLQKKIPFLLANFRVVYPRAMEKYGSGDAR
jgi:hypothetical protein